MAAWAGTKISSVLSGGSAEAAGVRVGDRLLAVNGHKVRDLIDFMFHRADETLSLSLTRRAKRFAVKLTLAEGEDPGLELEHFKIRTCRNKCLFCFVSQLPRGLRRALYVKDEDYRMSFLYGNYITLTNLGAEDKKRIVRQRLSPLYISVHTTDPGLRAKVLCNTKAPDIMKELQYFREHKIRMHTQIVLCPGLNDGAELKRTIRDLYSLYPYVASVAVVPVGLTHHMRGTIFPVDQEEAAEALEVIGTFQRRFMKKHGEAVVYAADEMYIRADRPFPKLRDYGEFPQLENGVGMVPSFMNRAMRMKLPEPPGAPDKNAPSILTFTGTSFYPYLARFAERLRKTGVSITVVPVENTLFGKSVTVAGLLTGRDMIKSLSEASEGQDLLLVPDVALKAGSEIFLDDVTVTDLKDALGINTRVIEATPDGLLEGLKA